jgi:hypothetical protein
MSNRPQVASHLQPSIRPCSIVPEMVLEPPMRLKTLRRLTWLSVLLCFVSWLATAESLNQKRDGVRVRLIVPDRNVPDFLL